MLGWRIYFDDGSTWDDRDGPWRDAPVDGVIFIVCREGERVHFHSGADYYVGFEDGSFAATGDLGPLLRRRPPIRGDDVKFGRWTSIANYERISARAREEWR